MKTFLLASSALLAVCNADIKFSRTINTITDATADVTISGCAATDKYGKRPEWRKILWCFGLPTPGLCTCTVLTFHLLHFCCWTFCWLVRKICAHRDFPRVVLFDEKYAHRDFPSVSTTTTGSNNCDLDWGKPYDVTYNVSLERPITTGATISADLKASIIPLKFDCPACGGNCSVKIPIVGKTINIALPPCPINPNALKGSKSITLPAKSPIPLKLDVKGSITVKNGDGTVLADVTVDVALDPNAEEEEQDTYYYGTLRKYFGVWMMATVRWLVSCSLSFFFLRYVKNVWINKKHCEDPSVTSFYSRDCCRPCLVLLVVVPSLGTWDKQKTFKPWCMSINKYTCIVN